MRNHHEHRETLVSIATGLDEKFVAVVADVVVAVVAAAVVVAGEDGAVQD